MSKSSIVPEREVTARAVVVSAVSWMAFSGIVFVLVAVWGVKGLLGLNAMLGFFWLVGRTFDRVLAS